MQRPPSLFQIRKPRPNDFESVEDMSKDNELCILIDTREQMPFDFTPCKGLTCKQATLPTGDYSLRGLTSTITIERKGSPAELAGNLFRGRARFERELMRMKSFAEPHVVLAFSFDDLCKYPDDEKSGIPWGLRGKIKARGPAVFKRLLEVQSAHPWVRWWFAGCHKQGRNITLALLKSAARKYPDEVESAG